MFRKVFAQTLVALAFAAAADAGRAEWRALLVGVADYPTLPAGVERTTGARNDVLLLREVLRQRGFKPEQIRVLADGVAGAELPTRANILRALDDLAAASAPGDSVFVHFSGHGSLEPGAAARGEGTPTFLPLNIGRWNGAAGVVENAIRQGDLRQRVDRIANRGAFVWGVFDACHSAVLVRRPGSPQLQRRFVDPAALGVPLGAIDGWRQGIEDGAGAAAAAVPGGAPVLRGVAAPQAAAAPQRGDTVFFYAAGRGRRLCRRGVRRLPAARPGALRRARRQRLDPGLHARATPMWRPKSYLGTGWPLARAACARASQRRSASAEYRSAVCSRPRICSTSEAKLSPMIFSSSAEPCLTTNSAAAAAASRRPASSAAVARRKAARSWLTPGGGGNSRASIARASASLIEPSSKRLAISSTCARSINNETTGILPSALLNGCGRLAQPASQPVASTASSTRGERSDVPRDGCAVIEREGGQRSCKAASCDDCSNGRARIAAP